MKTILKLATIIIVFFLHQSCNQSKAYDVNINTRNEYN